jgi:hypothetical protein
LITRRLPGLLEGPSAALAVRSSPYNTALARKSAPPGAGAADYNFVYERRVLVENLKCLFVSPGADHLLKKTPRAKVEMKQG